MAYHQVHSFMLIFQEVTPTVTTGSCPRLIYDYYGFPPESYKLQYPASGAPEVGYRVAKLLKSAGIACNEDDKRGFDHGVFIPLMLSYPDASVPVVQLSLASSLDPELHIRIGEALEPLRQEGVLIYASGMSFHNLPVLLRGPRGSSKIDPQSVAFDKFLTEIATNSDLSYSERRSRLINWEKGPSARYAHPREEHLIPLMVAFGAAQGDPGGVFFSGPLYNAQVSSYIFGSNQ